MVNAYELPRGETRDALALPEGGLAALPSHRELMFEGLFCSTTKVLCFPAMLRSDVLVILAHAGRVCIVAMHVESDTASTDIFLVGKGWRRLCVTLQGSRRASGLQHMYQTPAGSWVVFRAYLLYMPMAHARISLSFITSGVLLT